MSTNPTLENLKPWQPGQSGNPAGRPKGALGRQTLYEKWALLEDATGLTDADRIALGQIKKAVEMQDTTAAKEVMDSLFGKTSDKVELTGADGGPIVQATVPADHDIIQRYLAQKLEKTCEES